MKKFLLITFLFGIASMVACSDKSEAENLSSKKNLTSNDSVQQSNEIKEKDNKRNIENQIKTAPPYDWIDPNKNIPESVQYKLYDTPARGLETQGSYLVYLPESYDTDLTKKYPVIYFLHGGFGYSSDNECTLAIQGYISAMKNMEMPESIIVVPQALPSGWYCNSKDGSRPVEDVIVKDLIPHIDNTYRTISESSSRGIEGMSMGGYGALHLGLKYPEVFGVISGVAPAIRKSILDEPEIRTADTFFGDENYFYECSPWGLIELNKENILKNNLDIRVLGGEKDDLYSILDEFSSSMSNLGIKHTYFETSGAGHDYKAILEGNSEAYSFWNKAFEIK